MPKHAKSDFGDKMVETYEYVKDYVKQQSNPSGDSAGIIDKQVGEQIDSDLDKLKEKYRSW